MGATRELVLTTLPLPALPALGGFRVPGIETQWGLVGKEAKRPRRLGRWGSPGQREVEMLVYDERSSRFRKALFPAAIIASPEPAGPVVKPKAGRRMSPFSRGPVRTAGKKRASAWRRRPVPRRRPMRALEP